MGLTGYDLSQYPLEEHYRHCRKYINGMDWDENVNATREKGMIGIDISDAILLFPHLELDSEYRLICYTESGYHALEIAFAQYVSCLFFPYRYDADQFAASLTRI